MKTWLGRVWVVPVSLKVVPVVAPVVAPALRRASDRCVYDARRRGSIPRQHLGVKQASGHMEIQ